MEEWEGLSVLVVLVAVRGRSVLQCSVIYLPSNFSSLPSSKPRVSIYSYSMDSHQMSGYFVLSNGRRERERERAMEPDEAGSGM